MDDVLRRLFQAFDPVKPLQPEDTALYVELDDVRGKPGVVQKLADYILLSQTPTCQLLTGHRGSGKSTELGLLKHRLEADDPKHFVVFGQAAARLDVEDIGFPDLLLAIVGQLSDDLKTRLDISLKPEGFKAILDRMEQSVGDTFKITGLEVGAPFLMKLSATMKDSPSARQTIRQALDPATNDLIAAANDLIGNAMLKLQEKGYDGLAIIVDDLDKMPGFAISDEEATRAETLFIGRQAQLAAFKCHVVYTFPLELEYSRQAPDLDSAYGRAVPVIPMTKIRERPPSQKPHRPGMDRFQQIITKRLESVEVAEAQAFRSKAVQRKLIRLSGGEPRQLMILMREAMVGSELPISGETVERAARNLRRSYARSLRTEHWPVIEAVRASGQFSRSADNDSIIRDLLSSRAILQYRNDEDWYALNPLIEDMKPPTSPGIG